MATASLSLIQPRSNNSKTVWPTIVGSNRYRSSTKDNANHTDGKESYYTLACQPRVQQPCDWVAHRVQNICAAPAGAHDHNENAALVYGFGQCELDLGAQHWQMYICNPHMDTLPSISITWLGSLLHPTCCACCCGGRDHVVRLALLSQVPRNPGSLDGCCLHLSCGELTSPQVQVALRDAVFSDWNPSQLP